MEDLSGRTAIVTGATAGIGRETASALAAAGARLVLTGRRADRLAEAAHGIDARTVAGDITDPDVRRRIAEACGGRCDILVNNAGYGEPGPVELVTDADARRQFEVNLFAAVALVREVLPMMRARRWGRIVNVSSVAGRLGYPLFGWYCASKHALEGLSDALRLEVAPWGVRVALIEPGPVLTEFFDVSKGKALPRLEEETPYRPFFRHVDRIESDFMRQATTPRHVARVILAACRARRPRARYTVTWMAKAAVLAMRLLPRSLLDAVLRRQFKVPGPADVG